MPLLFVNNGDSGEKISKVFLLMLQRDEVFRQRRLFKVMTDRTDLIESISAAVAFHAMAQQTNGVEVCLLEAGVNRGEVSLSISKESRHNRFQIRIDLYDDLFLGGIGARMRHCGRALSKAMRSSRSVAFFNGLVMWALQPASKILVASSLSASAVRATI